MKILVINAGSSSLKYQLIDMKGEKVLAKGICERIGIGGKFTHKTFDGRVITKLVDMPNHSSAFDEVKNALVIGEGKVIDSLSEVSAIGHRVVQGGSKYDRSVLITPQVLKDIDELAALAPLHNKAHVQELTPQLPRSAPIYPRWRCSTPLFIRPFRQKRICLQSLMSITKNTISAVTVFTERPTDMCPPVASNCSANPTARGQGL